MMLEASSCERPSKSSARVFLPSSVSNAYSFSTGTQGRSRRFLLTSSFRSACSASSLASSSRATCHSSRVPTLCSGISSPFSSARPAGRDSRRLVRLFRIDGRPGCVHQSDGAILLVKLEQRLERLRLLVHSFPRVSVRPEPFRHRRDRELVRVDRVELFPSQ